MLRWQPALKMEPDRKMPGQLNSPKNAHQPAETYGIITAILLLEAGRTDNVPSVMEANQWPRNFGTERDWSFQAQPSPHVNGRSVPLHMGKVLGGGSSINAMAWSHGHKNDWDSFAAEAGDTNHRSARS